MSEALALLRQAKSDAWAAERVYDEGEPGSYCQSVAKCQQIAEKCVKAVAAALSETGPLSITTGFSHDPDRLLPMLLRLPRGTRDPAVRSIQFHINRVLGGRWWGEVRAVCGLVPSRPGPGGHRQKNTEYPYHNPDGTWRAPADLDSFSREDVVRYQRLVHEFHPAASRLVTGILRGTV